MVAPLVGAWIEIDDDVLVKEIREVAPLVGAWIEIKAKAKNVLICKVAPLVGAWIEMTKYGNIKNPNMSLLL